MENDMLTPPELKEIAQETTFSLLPNKSKDKYISAYNKFQDWRLAKQAPITENVLLAHFQQLSTKFKPSSLWSIYSFLKTTLQFYDNINIKTYAILLTFLKRKNENYKPKKAKILTEENIQKFLNDAPNQIFLATKVCNYYYIK